MLVITRFAPSPTGYLHIGSLRTALYSWLFARSKNGKFILRIEDTDFKRSTKVAISEIVKNLKWLGLDWDAGPYFQSEKIEYYKSIIISMIESGLAYKCYCTNDRLNILRKNQLLNGEKPKYDRKCRNFIHEHKNNAEYVVRFCNPLNGIVSFCDEIRGKISFNNNELDDVIIQRTSGIPTYNFCAVIDDRDMKITHVIRGEDHINNTPRQINLFNALQSKIPSYAHVSMILDTKGKKLSKRENVVSVSEYKFQGYLPDALLNYIVRLGWAHGNQEIFSINDMKKLFILNKVNPSPSRFDISKLLWLNRFYIRNLPKCLIKQHLKYQFKKQGIDYLEGPNLDELIDLVGSRYNTLRDMVYFSRYFYSNDITCNMEAFEKYLIKSTSTILERVYNEIMNIQIWSLKNVLIMIRMLINELNISFKELSMPVRVAITGDIVSPSIHIVIYGVGKKRSLLRIKDALLYIKKVDIKKCNL
ncbi:MAG: glutamate--tRNA ligase [Buchnera aphidicola (Nurudea yanoniella)]